MLQVRVNAFETNSSSVHSFYIKKDFKLEPFKEPKTITAVFNEYGWEYSSHNNTHFIDYCWSTLYSAFKINRDDDDGLKQWQRRVEEVLVPYNVFVNWAIEDDYNFVDHAGEFLPILDELLKQPELFISAIFCDDSYFLTSNDNGGEIYDTEKKGYALFIKGN